ncbi:thioredoxin domain-containing protein [Leptolyngbya sp. BC1307]|uniref:thioredoxin domain-containing protein n=1 Tax=Leptolyngbya sp. BC1307 TaxID=2029589 RepID=UPI000EFACA69|nr:thioredoxin domain-containing protein [Leptolyngbya sp. BC1307]
MTNQLADSSSLYLRKHAENPVDWWPWCDEALEKAVQEDKPIFLSIGYSSCHWCTVMEGEAFSDEAIATYLNANFLPIKVDREERPDIDSIYMQALQMIAGQGGWPLNIFLTPSDRVPFYGGTYFPVEARYGRPGFLQVLQALRQLYDTDTDKVESVKSQILGGLEQSAQLQVGALDQTLLPEGIIACARTLMPFDTGTRFPMIPYARLVLQGVGKASPVENRFLSAADSDTPIDGLHLVRQRAFNLVTGGIFDPVAGGFHRYTVDPTWTVPHFEKMLYDNGQIVEFLAEVWQSGEQSPAIARAIDQTVVWLQREMQADDGFFYAAQDADNFTSAEASEPEEGDFYVWSMAELTTLLTADELSELTAEFTVTEAGNFEGRNVLQRKSSGQLSQTVEQALEKLFQVRYGALPADTPTFKPAVDAQAAKTVNWPGRIPPVTDTKMIVAWNALMISGLAKAAAVFDRADYLAIALQATQYIQQHQQSEGTFYRLNYDGQAAVPAQAEDYALYIKALLDIQQACLRFDEYRAQAADWLTAAIALQTQFDQQLGSQQGGYFNATGNELIVQERAYQDSAIPSANGVAIASLMRLFLLTENQDYLSRAETALQSFSTVLQKVPRACPSLLSALDWFTHPMLIRTTTDQIPELMNQMLPTAVLQIEELPEGAIALVCHGLSCQAPATDIAMLQNQIKQSQGL